MEIARMRQRRTRQEWQTLLDEQQRSGLSIQRFCQKAATAWGPSV